jgi:hypothetical protein
MRSPDVALVARAPLALGALLCEAVGALSVGRVARIRNEVPTVLVASLICWI